jgi:asparagine N-glycosylation enzyme membrane subunit Stt3
MFKSLLIIAGLGQLYSHIFLLYSMIIAPQKPEGDTVWLLALICPFFVILMGTCFVLRYLFTGKSEKSILFLIFHSFLFISVYTLACLLYNKS